MNVFGKDDQWGYGDCERLEKMILIGIGVMLIVSMILGAVVIYQSTKILRRSNVLIEEKLGGGSIDQAGQKHTTAK